MGLTYAQGESQFSSQRLGLMWFVCDFFLVSFCGYCVVCVGGLGLNSFSFVNVFGVWGFVLCVWIRDVLFLSDATLLSKSGI